MKEEYDTAEECWSQSLNFESTKNHQNKKLPA